VGDAHAAGRVRFGTLADGDVAQLAAAFPVWSKEAITYCVVVEGGDPFNAGWDMRALARDPAAARGCLARSFALAWQLDCFTKPTVPLINGLVSGAGVGLSLYGTHRVAGEGFRWRMPGPAEGWFPDHGVTHVLAAMPGHIGTYLALTGATLGRADAYRLGLLTHCIPARAFTGIAERLSDADPVDPILDGLHEAPGPGALERYEAIIARCFSAPTLEDMRARLAAEQGADAAWAKATADVLAKASPLAAALTLRLLREARSGDLREALIRDYRVAHRLIACADVAAGGPPWSAKADAATLETYFAPLGGDELLLASRAEMQAPAI